MQIKFADGATLDALSLQGSTIFYQGFSRDSVEIQFSKDVISFDALNTLTNDGNKTSTIVTIDGNSQGELDNYSLRVSLSLKTVEIPGATPSGPTTTEERLSVVLAQKTYLETQLEENSKEVVNLRASYWALEASANERFKTLEVK